MIFPAAQEILLDIQRLLYTASYYLRGAVAFMEQEKPMLWLLAVIGIPILVVLLLFFAAADDFWQIVTLKISFSRLIGDLVHVLAILFVGAIAELFSIYMLFAHFL
jgi:hypothetical protein